MIVISLSSLVEKIFRERLTELQRPCHRQREKSEPDFSTIWGRERGAVVTRKIFPGSVTSAANHDQPLFRVEEVAADERTNKSPALRSASGCGAK
ncbi:MAG TPA: hypothetical protein VLA79_08480 [Polyangia bacterium]|nr:hypothetical protein [Polyangia bacterium]